MFQTVHMESTEEVTIIFGSSWFQSKEVSGELASIAF
jgi:hypothetical protein